jgi:hypothetical protein
MCFFLLPSLLVASSGKSLSKVADGFQPIGEFVVEMWSFLLPSLLGCSSGKSLSKLEDGFQAIWVFLA